MTVNDIHEIFAKGGKPLLAFLDYCVRSIQMDPVFVFLVREYRSGPTNSKAVALYDIFCAPGAPGRISPWRALAPFDTRLRDVIKRLSADETNEPIVVPPRLPARYLFDFLVNELEKTFELSPQLQTYNPLLTSFENLPGGKMTEVQRHFIQNVWEPVIRSRLVQAGFWRVGTIA